MGGGRWKVSRRISEWATYTHMLPHGPTESLRLTGLTGLTGMSSCRWMIAPGEGGETANPANLCAGPGSTNPHEQKA